MKKNITSKVLLFAGFMAAAIACDQDQDVSAVASPGDGKISFTFSQADLTVNEGQGEEGADVRVILYTVQLDKMQTFPIVVTANQIGGTADSDDYTISNATIAPYSTEAQLAVTILNDDEPEETETLELELEVDLANRFLLDPNIVYPDPITITIENYISDELEMTFAWGFDLTLQDQHDHDYVVHACDSVDFDIFIADAEGFDINDPWATFNDAVMAATGDCPEEMTFDLGTLPDGSYVIFANLWSNTLSQAYNDIEETPMPITATFTRAGAFLDKVVVQKEGQVLSSLTPGADNDNYDDQVVDVYIATVTIANGVYTVTDIEGGEIASGRIGSREKASPSRTPRPASTMFNK